MNTKVYSDSNGRSYPYGEFFPAELSPFAYNETVAQHHFPLSLQNARAHGYAWNSEEVSHHVPTIKSSDIPQTIADVDDDILSEILACKETGRAFRIVQQELIFYKKMNVPLPDVHPEIRYQKRLKQRNPYKLWKRTTEDGVEVMTPYAPDRPEKIYSEEGYQKLIL